MRVSLLASVAALALATSGCFDFDGALTDCQDAGLCGNEAAPEITTGATLADGYVGRTYSAQLAVTGGTLPITYAVTGGGLPAGVSLDAATGALSGSPTGAGAASVTITAEDRIHRTATATFDLRVYEPPQLDTASLADGYVIQSYNQTLAASKGKAPYAFSLEAGDLPGGVTLGATGALSGTPNGAGTASFTVRVSDANGVTASKALSVVVYALPQLPQRALADGYLSTAYADALAATGGKPPLGYAVTSGQLPAGVTLAADGALSGTPTATGAATVTVTVTDANGKPQAQQYTATIYALPAITTAALADGYLTQPYTGALNRSGGRDPVTFAITSGALPSGVTMTAGGTLSGTPVTAGASSFTVTATDANGKTSARPFTLDTYDLPSVPPLNLADAYVSVAYSANLAGSGGKAPLSYAITSGTAPTGLSLAATTGVLAGTPTATGSATLTITVTDANGRTGNRQYPITAYALPSVTTTTLADAYVSSPYSANLVGAGGKAPLAFTITSGSPPAGLSLTGTTTLSGTATVAGATSFTVTVTDANGQTGTRPLALDAYAIPTLPNTGSLPDGYVGTAYSGSLTATGGKAPLVYEVTTGNVPPGVTYSAAGAFGGTPTAAMAPSSVTFTVTDANGRATNRTYSMAAYTEPSITTTALPDAYTDVPYSQNIGSTGGKSPLTFTVEAGGLPVGLNLTGNNIGGQASLSGPSPFTLKVTDANGHFATRPLNIDAYDPPTVASSDPLTDGVKAVPYSEQLQVAGGKAPFTWTRTAGNLPAGLTLTSTGANAGLIAGTPTTVNRYSFTVQVRDANNRGGTGALSIEVYDVMTVTTGATLATAYQSVPYNVAGTALQVAGGKSPYNWAVTAGALPTDLNLSSAGVISGTPSVAVTSQSFTVTVTDANASTASKTFTLRVVPPPSISTTTTLDGYVGRVYADSLTAQDGKPPYSFDRASGTLPAGLSLLSNGDISGTPGANGTASFTARVTDSNGLTATKALSLAVYATPDITTTALNDAYQGSLFSQAVLVAGGKAPLTFTAVGSLPAGLALSAGGVISGTATATGTANYSVTVTDANGLNASKSFSHTVLAALDITSTLADGYVGLAYGPLNLVGSGGKPPYSYSVGSGSLPAGLSLTAGGVLSGTPTTASAGVTFALRITDANNQSKLKSFTVPVFDPPAITTTTVADAYAGAAYSASLIGAGGKSPVSWSLASGTLPTGISLSAAGVLSGTSNAVGDAAFTVRLTDANGISATRALTLSVRPVLVVSTTTLPDGYRTAAYATTLAATGGRAPYSFAVTAGSPPAGVTLAANGDLTGAPTAVEAASFTVTVTDANGQTATQALTLDVYDLPAVVTTALADAYQGDAYAETIVGQNGKAPYGFTAGSGLPPGISLSSGGALTGSATAAGTFNFTVTLTDANGRTAAQALVLIVRAPLSVATASLADGYQGASYSATLTAAGGVAPFGWTTTAGSLPAGLTLAPTGAISGTPTAAGIASFTVEVTDGNGAIASRPLTLEVRTAPSITTPALADAYDGRAYSATISGAGGRTPYAFALTAGALPGGLSLQPSGALTGTPSDAAGTFNFTVTLTDANGITATQAFGLVLLPALQITTASVADPYVTIPYAGGFSGSGGKPAYAWALASGTLPAGLTLDGGSGALTGTPTTAGTSSFSIALTDGNGTTVTRAYVVQTYVLPTITTTSLPDAVRNSLYSQTLTGSGGKTAYAWAVIGAGTLPPGITLSGATLSGTPTTVGTFAFDVQLTDANGRQDSQSLSITVAPETVFVITSTSPLGDGYVGTAYNFTFQATGGVLPYTFSADPTGPVPPGMTLTAAGVLSGTPTTAGPYTLVINAQDSQGTPATAQKSFAFTVYSPPAIVTTALPDGYSDALYNQTLTASGGKPPLSWTSTALPAGMTLSSTGTLSGTGAASSTTVTFTVTDATGRTATQAIPLAIFAPPTIAPVAAADVYIGSDNYSFFHTVSGGKPAYTWTISAGALPSGLSLNASSGTVSGVVSAGATGGNVDLRATDLNGRFATVSRTFTVYTLPSLTAAALPQGYVNVGYNAAITGTGGKLPYTFSTTGGVLPPGLTLSSSGAISGQPQTSGNSSFTVQLADANGKSTTGSYSISVTPPLTITTTAVPDGYLNESYGTAIAATGGRSPYNFSLAGGTLPPGITLSSFGQLSGTPTTQGQFSFTVRVQDANLTNATQSLTLQIFRQVTVDTLSLADGYTDQGYSAPLAASGGKPGGYTWTVTVGAPPAGISLGANGALTGTPQQPIVGTNFTVTATDLNGHSGSKPFTLSTYAPPVISVTGGLPDSYSGRNYSAALPSSGGKAPFTWTVQSGSPPPGVIVSANLISGPVSSTAGHDLLFGFSVVLQDANFRNAIQPFTIHNYRPPQILNPALANATEGISYRRTASANERIDVQYGKPGYTFSQTGLPAGLTMGAGGFITGVPAFGTQGLRTVGVSVADSNNVATTATFQLQVGIPQPISGGGTSSSWPTGDPLTDTLTVLVIDGDGQRLDNMGVRLRKNGVEMAPIREAATDPIGRAVFSGLGFNGTTDRVDVTAAGYEYVNNTLAGINASVVTMKMQRYPLTAGRAASSFAFDGAASGYVFGGQSSNDDRPVNFLSDQCASDLLNVDVLNNAWSEVVPPRLANGPGPRSYAALVLLDTGELVLFGGRNCATGQNLDDTWIFQNGVWQQVATTGARPPARYGHAMAARSQQAYLFGGYNGAYAQDVWRLDLIAGAWVWTSLGNAPVSGRTEAAAVNNRKFDELWFCGGYGPSGVLADCLAIRSDGSMVTGLPLPVARRGHSMAFSMPNNEVYLFGGADMNGNSMGDLWMVDGAAVWTQVAPNGMFPGPGGRIGAHLMVEEGGRPQLFGGVANYRSVALDDLWTWDGNRWSPINPRLPGGVTHVISGTVTGLPATASSVSVTVSTSSGWENQAYVSLVNGTGSYAIYGVPDGQRARLTALAQDGSSPLTGTGNWLDLGDLGTINADQTQNLVFGAPPTPNQLLGNYTLPANWGPYTYLGPDETAMPYSGLVGFRQFTHLIGVGGSDEDPVSKGIWINFHDPGAGRVLNLTAQHGTSAPVPCENERVFSRDVAAGIPLVNFVNGPGDYAPGRSECRPLGRGFDLQGYYVPNTPVDSAIADVTSDGRKDLVVLSQTAIAVTPMMIDGLLDTGSSTSTLPTGSLAVAMAVADLDRDGALDVVVADNGSTRRVLVMKGNGNGTFVMAANLPLPGAANASDVAVWDFDASGTQDLVLTSPATTQLLSWRNTSTPGSFSFATLANVLTAAAPRSVVTGVFNGSQPGVVVSLPSFSGIQQLNWTGSGFSAMSMQGTVSGAWALAAADLNADGKTDVAVSGDNAPGQVAVFTQPTTGGQLVLAKQFPVPAASLRGLAAGDFDGDGDVDLAVTSQASARVYLFDQTSGFNFTQGSDYTLAAGTGPGNLATGDLDGEGSLDLAVATQGNTAYVMLSKRLPTVAEGQFTFTSVANARAFMLTRGPIERADWTYLAPLNGASGAAVSVVLPKLPSVGAPGRPTLPGQYTAWKSDLVLSSTPLDLNNIAFEMVEPDAFIGSGGRIYLRQ